jgi:hypothetical protein
MSEAGLRRGLVALGLAGLAALGGAGGAEEAASSRERPKTATSVSTRVEGGGGLEAVRGAPPPLVPPSGPTQIEARIHPPAGIPRPEAGLVALKAVSMAEGEAMLEVEGERQTVRAGARLLQTIVKSVAPGRLVLERPRSGARATGQELVVVTFDEAGRAQTRVLWTVDPTAPAAPEVSRP